MWVGVFLVFRVTLERSRVRAVLARPAPVYYVPPLSGTSPAPAG